MELNRVAHLETEKHETEGPESRQIFLCRGRGTMFAATKFGG
jgi:hypothetical protein